MFKFVTSVFLCLCCFLLYGATGYCQAYSPIDVNIPVTDSLIAAGNLRQVPDGRVKTYQRNPDFAYANDPAYWKDAPPESAGLADQLFRFLSAKAFRIGLFIVFLLVLIYAIYRLAKENSFTWFTRSIKTNQNHESAERESSGETDLGEAIKKHSEAGNYRLAIRYMYLRMIRSAFEKETNGFRVSATNADMIRTFQNQEQAGDFRFLATAYEYIFYGGFTPDREQFELLQKRFDLFHQTLER